MKFEIKTTYKKREYTKEGKHWTLLIDDVKYYANNSMSDFLDESLESDLGAFANSTDDLNL